MAALGEEKSHVVRSDIRELSPEEQLRFVAAVKHLMQGKKTNVWKELAEIHGRHCAHGREIFPCWHRAYLLRLEMAVQNADKSLGNDGNIAVPYWDCTRSVGDEFVPKIIYDEFSKLPGGMGVRINRASEASVKRDLAGIDNDVLDCLDSTEHYRHASTRWVGWDGPSVEVPHNNVHVALGYPMSSVQNAAFDPMFWLHHCNVDRIYESYLKIETDSQTEFQTSQRSFAQSGDDDLYGARLVPFKLGSSDDDFYPANSFITQDHGYEYDKLIPQRPQALKAPPTVALFKSVDIMLMEGNTYQVHVFAVKNGEEGEFKTPETVTEYYDNDNYCGNGAIFGRGVGCTNCEKRDPFNVMVDMTATMDRIGASRYDVSLKVMCVVVSNPDRPVVPIEETPIPRPTIVGPAFLNTDSGMKQNDDASHAEDIRALQRYLERFGHYSTNLDGDFGANTDNAVKSYQQLTGLNSDGWAGPNTMKQILQPRCYNPDNEAAAEERSQNASVYYWVGQQPGSLNRSKTLEEIQKAFFIWGEVCGVSFTRVDTKEEAKIPVEWTYEWVADRDTLFPFDGKGLTLARGTPEYLNFDRSETWLLQDEESKTDAYYLLPVAVHEIGHCLGLSHSSSADDIMAPYYQPDKLQLSDNDIRLVKERYVG